MYMKRWALNNCAFSVVELWRTLLLGQILRPLGSRCLTTMTWLVDTPAFILILKISHNIKVNSENDILWNPLFYISERRFWSDELMKEWGGVLYIDVHIWINKCDIKYGVPIITSCKVINHIQLCTFDKLMNEWWGGGGGIIF